MHTVKELGAISNYNLAQTQKLQGSNVFSSLQSQETIVRAQE